MGMTNRNLPNVQGLGVAEAAVKYAEAGFYVHPLTDTVNGKCSCAKGTRCDKGVGKHPRTVNGVHDASNDVAAVTKAWETYPTANIGLAAGPSGILIIDIDTKDGKKGAETLAALEAEHGKLPETLTVRTWSGGLQLYFLMPEESLGNSSDRLGPNIDTRGVGGYGLAPGSVVHSKRYEVITDTAIAALPEWVESKLRKTGPKSERQAAVNPQTGEVISEYIGTPDSLMRVVNRKLEDIRYAPVGSAAEPVVNSAAFFMSHYIPHQLNEADVREWIEEAVSTWYDGIDKGLAGMEHGLRHIGEDPVLWEDDSSGFVVLKPDYKPSPGQLPPSFWESRKNLEYIRDVAHKNRTSAPALLGRVLARLSSLLPVGTLAGSASRRPLSLNTFVNVVSSSGGGKSSGSGLERELLPVPAWLQGGKYLDGVGLSTGQGITAAFVGKIEVPTGEYKKGKDGSQEEIMRQEIGMIRHNASFAMDEGEVFQRMRESTNSTVMGIIRQAGSGETMSQQNASAENTRHVPGRAYCMAITMNFQESTSLALLEEGEINAGTPQRFLWLPARDDYIPPVPEITEDMYNDYSYDDMDDYRVDPLPIDPLSVFTSNAIGQFDVAAAPDGKIIRFHRGHRAENNKWIEDRDKGLIDVPLVDSHFPGTRSKVAALLALLDGRDAVNQQDWDLAHEVWRASCEVRDSVIEYGKTIKQKESREANEAWAKRQVAATRAVREDEEKAAEVAVSKWAGKVLVKLADGPLRVSGTGSLLQLFAGKVRPQAEAGLYELIEAGRVVEEDGEYRLTGANRK